MKKIFTFLLFAAPLFLSVPRSYSQTTDTATRVQDNTDDEDAPPSVKKKHAAPASQKAVFGFECGYDWADLRFGPTWTQSVSGIRLGVLVDVPLCRWLSFRPGLAYMTTGADGIGYTGLYTSQSPFPESHVWKVSTIDMPLYLLLKTGHPGHGRFFAGGGVALGYNVGGSVTPSDVNSGAVRIGSSATDDIKALDISLGLTAGYSFWNGAFFSLRADWGQNDLQPRNEAANSDLEPIHSSDLVLQIGYVFGKKPKHKPHRTTANDDLGRDW